MSGRIPYEDRYVLADRGAEAVYRERLRRAIGAAIAYQVDRGRAGDLSPWEEWWLREAAVRAAARVRRPPVGRRGGDPERVAAIIERLGLGR